jgi:hypothetical protein
MVCVFSVLLVSKGGVYLKTVLLAILASPVVLPTLVRAADYNVGVKVGDWIKYGQFTVNWTGNGTEPASITDQKKVDWLRIDIENVSGTTVTLNMTVHYGNGTQIPQNGSVDVAGGTGISGGILIAANLKSGDKITNQSHSPMINQTTTGVYAGASRNVNFLEATSIFYNQTTTTRTYWDQSTGVVVEAYSKIPYYGNTDAYTEISLKATETNMWSADLVGILSNNIIYVIAGIVATIIIVETAIFLRRRKPPSPQQPPPAPLAERVRARIRQRAL